ncbi:hypothetical protein M5D96_006493, partial [Drosophila gunungcola]
DEKFVLLPAKSVYTVGRLGTDLIVSQDLSISRNHVEIHLPKDEGDDSLQCPVGIRIRFGGNLSIWQVTRLKLVTAVSALTRPEIKWLAEMLEPLGGTVSPDWTEECTHLTMNEVSVTVKLLHALLENKPIKLLLSAQKVHVTEGWPQPEDYQPTNMDVTWRPERTRLFAGKTFVFMNRKHFEMYGSVVQKAGASCKDLNSGVRKTFLTKSDEFCNPTHKFINESLPITESVTSSMAFNSSIIVPNTERNTAQSIGSAISELVVPESDAVELEQQSSQADSEPKTSGRSLHEEQEATSSKRAKPVVQEKPKKIAKNAILVDSSDEEENVQPPAPVPAAKKYAPKRGKPIYCADSSDEENTASKKQPESTVPKPEAPVVSRTSPRLSSKSVATNITNQQPEKQSTGSKRPVLSVALDDEEDVGDLFQFRKSPKKTTERVVQPKSAAKEKPPGRISTQPRKRLRLEPLNESDSDDCENLFNFADSKKKKKNPENQTHEDSTDGLFNFNSERPSDAVDQDSVLTEPFIPEVETKKKSKLHDDFKSEIKSDPEVSLENSIKTDPDEEKWLSAMKDSIQVRMCNLNIINRSQDELDASLGDSSVSKYSGRKNFKKFVKASEEEEELSGDSEASVEEDELSGDSEEEDSNGSELDLAASDTESDEDDDEEEEKVQPAPKSRAEIIEDKIHTKYEQLKGTRLYKLPLDVEEFNAKVKALHPLVVKSTKPRQKHARFCLVDFKSKEDRDQAFGDIKTSIEKDAKYKGIFVSLPKTDSDKFVNELTAVENRRTKSLMKRATKKVLAKGNFTSSVVITNLPKTSSLAQVRQLFEEAVDIQIRPGKGKFRDSSAATVTLPTTHAARKKKRSPKDKLKRKSKNGKSPAKENQKSKLQDNQKSTAVKEEAPEIKKPEKITQQKSKENLKRKAPKGKTNIKTPKNRSRADGEQFCGAAAAPPPLPPPSWVGGGGGGCAGGDLSGIEGWTNRTRSASVDAALLLAAAAPAAALKADVKAVAAQRATSPMASRPKVSTMPPMNEDPSKWPHGTGLGAGVVDVCGGGVVVVTFAGGVVEVTGVVVVGTVVVVLAGVVVVVGLLTFVA